MENKKDILDKAFSILEKAGFTKENLDKAYGILESECAEWESKVEIEIESRWMKVDEPKADEWKDMKAQLLSWVQSLLEKLSK